MAETKYTVKYKGEVMSIRDYAELMGVDYDTIRCRAREGRPITAPVRGQAIRKDSIMPRRGGYKDGYSFDELLELYQKFADSENELQILSDFTGLTRREVMELRDKLRKERARRRYA